MTKLSGPSGAAPADHCGHQRGLLAGDSCRAVAARLRRAPSTVSREVMRAGGAARYRAWRADESAVARQAVASRTLPARCASLSNSGGSLRAMQTLKSLSATALLFIRATSSDPVRSASSPTSRPATMRVGRARNAGGHEHSPAPTDGALACWAGKRAGSPQCLPPEWMQPEADFPEFPRRDQQSRPRSIPT